MDLTESLRRFFGHDTFRPGQEAVISRLLPGRSVLALFPTGAGKSLCYQLPALLLDGLTLVVSPLIALMKDQVGALQARGLAAERLDSTLSPEEVNRVYSSMEDGSLKLLYVSPERLANAGFLKRLQRCDISLFAVDEAHCLSEWGHNFRPDYLRLPEVARSLGAGRVLALTATATPAVAAQIRERFGIAEEDQVQTGFARPNLRFRVHPCTARERDRRLVDLLGEAEASPAIVYVTLQETSERVAGLLKRAGIAARAYHAGMRDEDRAEVQDGFMDGLIPVVVATIAFGMGVDKSDIRRVVHFNLPKSLENYVQESGRAGRDGAPAVCDILACADDLTVLENFIYGDTPSPTALKSLVEHVLLRGEAFSVSRYDLSQSRDIRQTVVETALTYLEMEGLLVPEGPFYGGSEVRLLRPFETVLAGLPHDRKELLRRLFETGKAGRLWHRFDHGESATALGVTEEMISRILSDLAVHGEAVRRPYGLRHAYHLGAGTDRSVGAVAARLADRFASREVAEIARLHQVVDLCETPQCLPQQLIAHFGESIAPCGNCAVCLGEHAGGPLPATKRGELTLEDAALIREAKAEHHPALRQPRQLARFLCGLSSPATTRARLNRDDRFGALAEVPFLEVLDQCESF
ncbi:MAG: RecQ family ATP-dependent DNA helicase [Verrucomicrobiales bacterium]|nr:RecQ family ATP-dependent DNA helicase [Verrucomicrobiales bacterium]